MPGHKFTGRHADFTMGSANALEQRPRLAVEISIVTSIWSEIDLNLELFLCCMLGADYELGINMYLEIRSEKAQHDIIKKIAQDTLSSDVLAELVVFINRLRNKVQVRNEIVHGIWGIAPKYPDDLLWI